MVRIFTEALCVFKQAAFKFGRKCNGHFWLLQLYCTFEYSQVHVEQLKLPYSEMNSCPFFNADTVQIFVD